MEIIAVGEGLGQAQAQDPAVMEEELAQEQDLVVMEQELALAQALEVTEGGLVQERDLEVLVPEVDLAQDAMTYFLALVWALAWLKAA